MEALLSLEKTVIKETAVELAVKILPSDPILACKIQAPLVSL